MEQCTQLSALSMISNLMKNCPPLNSSETDELNLLLQTLCAICDTHSECSPIVANWALNTFLNGPMTNCQPPMALFNLILAPSTESNVENYSKIIEVVLNSKMSHWDMYKIARTAFR